MARRDAMLSMLLEEQQREARPEPKKRGITPEDILGFAAGAAPIAGTVGGTLIGGPAGAAVGGGIGALGGLGAGFLADKMRRDREEKEMREEEEAQRELRKKQALASLL